MEGKLQLFVEAAASSDLVTWEHVGPARWVRALSDDIRAVLRLSALKGARFQLDWGLSIDWVPVTGNDGLALWEEGQYHGAVVQRHLDHSRGAATYDAREIKRCWHAVRPCLAPLLTATTPTAVAALAEAQLTHPSGPTIGLHDPHPSAVLEAARARS